MDSSVRYGGQSLQGRSMCIGSAFCEIYADIRGLKLCGGCWKRINERAGILKSIPFRFILLLIECRQLRSLHALEFAIRFIKVCACHLAHVGTLYLGYGFSYAKRSEA